MPENSQISLLERYQRLIEISRGLASTLDLDVLLDRIVHAAADLSNASEASILLYDETKGELVFQAATNKPQVKGLSVPVGGSIAGWIISNREPIIIADVLKDERYFKNIEKASKVTTQSLLGVPLITKNKVIGALEAINKKNGGFTSEDQEILMTLGAQAAIAIQNTRLFQQSDLIAEFVHEIRTPLSSITTAAQLLQYPQLPSEKHEQMATIIQTESIRLSEMATSFLNLARLESGRSRFDLQQINIHQLLVECVNLMEMNATQDGLTLSMACPKDLPIINGDYDKIKQAIINLLSNAIKYNRPGGQIFLRSYSEVPNIIIEVADTGIGISSENQNRLFEKFYRVPGSENISFGTGLGLTVVKRIVEGHQGTVTAKSVQGEGTTFKLSFPMA
ncbi:MAG: sensor histidine kinase [Candidatus Hermodarchaeia archaeon]|jgi:K+-sensing histidine kinase KdpD